MPSFSTRWQWSFFVLSLPLQPHAGYRMTDWARHLPCQTDTRSGSFNFTQPHRPQPLERGQYFNEMGHSKLRPNKDHALVGAPESPPCCIHLYGSAALIQTIWGAEWICREPVKRQATHSHHSLLSLFVFPPLPGHAAFLRSPGGSPLKSSTSFMKTGILQHMLTPPLPPYLPLLQRSKGNIKKNKKQNLWQADGQTHITLTWVHTSPCQGWMSAGEQRSSADVLIKRDDNSDVALVTDWQTLSVVFQCLAWLYVAVCRFDHRLKHEGANEDVPDKPWCRVFN